MIGNFSKISKKRPKNCLQDYKVMIPYDEFFAKWERVKIGKVTCDCVMVLETYMPYYGCMWYHSEECALMKQMKAKPHLWNLWCYQQLPLLAQKNYTIKGYERLLRNQENDGQATACGENTMQVSDGYHTMDELYDHRIALFIALYKKMQRFRHILAKVENYTKDETVTFEGNGTEMLVWRSRLHSDGSGYGEWFILGLGKDKGEQITYHLPMIRWSETDFAETLEKAPEWDGHTSADVLERLKML